MALRRIFARVGICDWGRDGGFFSFPLSSSRDRGRGLGLELVRGFVRRCIGTSVCSGLDVYLPLRTVNCCELFDFFNGLPEFFQRNIYQVVSISMLFQYDALPIQIF